MAKGGASTQAIGFLTVVDHAQHGLFGGYLLLNLLGRPLEFHCTTPVKANRAQQILYGPTLEPYLYCEQIGQTLVAKASVEPQVICTDVPVVLALRQLIALPVALVLPSRPAEADSDASASEPANQSLRVDRAHTSGASFHVGRNRLAVNAAYDDDRQPVAERLGGLEEHFDLSEPFNRIREAIQEAQGKGTAC